jgi:hypothetical protein
MLANVVTAEDLATIQALLLQILEQQTAAAQPVDDYLSLAQVAYLTGTTEKTVRKWIAVGKPDHKGKTIKLYTLEFSPGFPRIPRSALLAFGQGLGFDAAQLALPVAGAKPAAKAKPPVLDSSEALRKAS